MAMVFRKMRKCKWVICKTPCKPPYGKARSLTTADAAFSIDLTVCLRGYLTQTFFSEEIQTALSLCLDISEFTYIVSLSYLSIINDVSNTFTVNVNEQ